MLTKQELRQLQDKELMEELSKSSRELLKARMEHSGGTLKETHRLVELKIHIARMMTIMNEDVRAPITTASAVKVAPETARKTKSEPARANKILK